MLFKQGGGWIDYAQFHVHNWRDLLQHKVWLPIRQRMPAASSAWCWNIGTTILSSTMPTVDCLSHSNGKSPARHPIHPTHQHWFLHTCNITHPAFIYSDSQGGLPLKRVKQCSHWFFCNNSNSNLFLWPTWAWLRRRLSKLLRTMLAELLPSCSLPLYIKLFKLLRLEVADSG